jgi:2-isopropylmalate synthase
MQNVTIYDTTLRDGTQAEDISLSVQDKIRITEHLDAFGVHYIEGGWPGSNPRDIDFFKEVQKLRLKRSRLVAFGSTRRQGVTPGKDKNLRAIMNSGVQVATIFGKSWDLHVKHALRVSMKENLAMIRDSVSYLKKRLKEVIYDAEHFMDGYKANPEYALQTLMAAEEGGADIIVLCDTNGGTLPFEIGRIMSEVKQSISTPLGIHAHNDTEMAVANSIMAVRHGAVQIHGTINGYGERCGNANLCSIIPNLVLKLKIPCVRRKDLSKLKDLSGYVSEIANLPHIKHLPYVGDSAFAHKAGIHVSAVRKMAETYEHIRPENVGNHQRVLVSDLSGKSNILYKAKKYGIDLDDRSMEVRQILRELKILENQGFQFEGAEASFEVLMNKALGKKKRFFDLLGFRVINEKKEDEATVCEATIMMRGPDGTVVHEASVGNGPVNALDNALRKALYKFYPELKDVRLTDYKVRVLTEKRGTSANVRVLTESSDGVDRWGTVGVSENVVEASWQALVDSLVYKLMKKK